MIEGQPVANQYIISLPAGQANGTKSISVPADKWLVLETVTARVIVPSGQTPEVKLYTPTFLIPSGTVNVGHQVALVAQPGGTAFHASLPLRLYCMPGGAVMAWAGRGATTGTASYEITWSGYLVAP
jgi:hypothetical protein